MPIVLLPRNFRCRIGIQSKHSVCSILKLILTVVWCRLGGVAPQKEYASRYSNPNHPAQQGLFGLVTGGKVNPSRGIIRGRDDKFQESAETADKLTARNVEMYQENVASDGISRYQVAWQAVRRRKPRGMRRVLRQDVLYLMVVNMPSEKEMEAVKRNMGNLGDF